MGTTKVAASRAAARLPTRERVVVTRLTPARAVALTRLSLPTPAPEAGAQTPTTQQTQRTNFHF